MPHDDMRLCVCACSLTIPQGETMGFRVRNDRTRRKTACFLSFGTTKSKISAPAAGYRGAPPPGSPPGPWGAAPPRPPALGLVSGPQESAL